MSTPEFSRSFALDTLGEPRTVEIVADAAERAALATRFDLLTLDRLEAQAVIARDGTTVTASGQIRAAVAQACVATGVELPRTIDEPFTVRFVPETDVPDEEIEVEAEALDDIAYEGQAIDLGEAVAQTLALALDPFPRAPDADAVLRAAGVLQEGEATAPTALAGLKDLFKK